MNPSELLEAILADLSTYVQSAGGNPYLAADPLHALEILASGPGQWGCVLLDKGDEPDQRGPVQLLKARWSAYIYQNRGLSVDPGDKIPGLVERCEGVRDRILSKVYPAETTTQNPVYEGRLPVTLPDGLPLNAYEMNFSLRLAGTNPLNLRT